MIRSNEADSKTGNDNTPTLTVSGVSSGDTVTIYSDNSCSTLKGTESS